MTTDIDLYNAAYLDASDPRNVINLMSHFMKEHALAIPTRYWEMSETELQAEVFGQDSRPDTILNRLRIAFWDEYERCQKELCQMEVRRIISNICPQPYFIKKVVPVAAHFAWVLTPPPSYMASVKEVLNFSLDRQREVLLVSPVKSDGTVDTKLAEIQLKIAAMADMRINGAIVQRIDQRSINMNLNANANDDATKKANLTAMTTMEELDARIREVKAAQKRISIPAQLRAPDILDSPSQRQHDVVEKVVTPHE